MATQKLTTEILNAAMEGFEAQKRRIDEQIAEIRRMLDGNRPDAVSTPESPKPKRKRRLSAAGRRAIAEAARKRWAALRSAKEAPGKSAVEKRGAKKAFARGKKTA